MRDLDLKEPLVLEESLVVSASAGSGKTFTITVLVAAALGKETVRPHEILATTFSEAAAADLRVRLLRPLDLLAALDEPAWKVLLPLLGEQDGAGMEAVLQGLGLPERLVKSAQELTQAVPHWQGAAWASSAAKARAFWRRTRREAELLQVSTIHSLALGLLRQGEGAPEAILDAAHPALLRLLRQTVREVLDLPETDPDQVPARVLLAWAEKHYQTISEGHDGHRDAMGELTTPDPAVLRKAFHAALEAAEAAFSPFAADPTLAGDPSSSQRRYFKPSLVLRIPGPGAGLMQRFRWAESQSRAVSAVGDPPVPKGYFSKAFHEPYASLGPVAEAWEAWLGSLLAQALRVFEQRKERAGMATFGDMVRKALTGMDRGEIEPPRPKLLLVDEYQDTSRAQDAFLTALGAERTVQVGDLKQAIYGFRGGDPGLLRQKLADAGERAFRLPCNFRSSPAVVELANRYVGEVWPQLDPGASELDGRQVPVSTSSLPVALHRSVASGRGADLPGLAGWIAALSREAGWNTALGAPAKAKPRRRALLLRQRTKLPELLLSLKKQGIQPYVVARDGFWDSPGVRLLLTALEAVAHPERIPPCVALLRNLLGLSDAEITVLAAPKDGRSGLAGLGGLDPEAFPEARREGVRWLQGLRGATTQELAGRLLAQGALLGLIRALSVHGVMEPPRARRNLSALLARLLALPASPFAAYALLEEERSGKERGDLPAAVEGADLIIQTVHGSKGLEYDDVILPLLNARPQPMKHGDLRTLPGQKELMLAWKMGQHPGQAYRQLKPLVAERQRKDDLNLLYVGCTRAQERLVLMLQAPEEPKAAGESNSWAEMGHHLTVDNQALVALAPEPPAPAPPDPREEREVQPPPGRQALAGPLAEAADPGGAHHGNARARQDGEDMHAFLRDLLVRWEDAQAFRALLDAPPQVARARENASRFLEQFEARGWRRLRRRTEYPVAGAAASGAEGRADLVVWDQGRIHLLDFKHSKDFGVEDLEGYRKQLRRYALALEARDGLPVEAWLVALKSGEWVEMALG